MAAFLGGMAAGAAGGVAESFLKFGHDAQNAAYAKDLQASQFKFMENLQNNQAGLQRQNFDYLSNQISQSYAKEGLPTWLAYTGGPGVNFQHQSTPINGNNFMVASIPGNVQNDTWTNSFSQNLLGAGDIPTAS